MLALAAPREDRIARLTRAEATLAASPARLEHARALVDLGSALAAVGRRAEGRAVLRQGVEQAAACGATVLQRRAHEALAASGARPQRERFTGVDSLTASERRIVEMAVTGMSNAEIAQGRFVTTSTVDLDGDMVVTCFVRGVPWSYTIRLSRSFSRRHHGRPPTRRRP